MLEIPGVVTKSLRAIKNVGEENIDCRLGCLGAGASTATVQLERMRSAVYRTRVTGYLISREG